MPTINAASEQGLIPRAVFLHNLLSAYPGRALQGLPLSESKIQGKHVQFT